MSSCRRELKWSGERLLRASLWAPGGLGVDDRLGYIFKESRRRDGGGAQVGKKMKRITCVFGRWLMGKWPG